ncbi:NifU family protein [Streptomyces sp. JJ66]|uniref:NifU family protein n=1 Tax=Streptomyces sp. JJ66 TaxID=2803843 RepID=UPI001C592905|nr:NifU family protein [Streptomyces sp. JJ66]MBW1601923.1 NifU family protein [Streptomyces sp. JJ66]
MTGDAGDQMARQEQREHPGWDDAFAREQVRRAEEQLGGLDALPDSAAAARARETVETLVGLYGDALARVLHHAEQAGGDALARRLADDELVGHLLLVHDLHPDPPAARARRALDAAAGHLRGLGLELDVAQLTDATAHVRLTGTTKGCSPPPVPPEQTVRDALTAAAPELADVQVERAAAPAAPAPVIPVDALFQRPAPVGGTP